MRLRLFALAFLLVWLPSSYAASRGFSGRPYHPSKGWKTPGTKRPR
jgi:hypothetical protein